MAKIVIPVITIGGASRADAFPASGGPFRALRLRRSNANSAGMLAQITGRKAVNECGDGQPCRAVAQRMSRHEQKRRLAVIDGLHAKHTTATKTK